MVTRASCGHIVNIDDEVMANIKGVTREWSRCVEWRSMCPYCYVSYLAEDMVLHTEKDEEEYLDER